MQLKWVDGFTITFRIEGGAAILAANREGMLSLANHLAALADAAPGSHLHLDATNALEDGSAELILERTK